MTNLAARTNLMFYNSLHNEKESEKYRKLKIKDELEPNKTVTGKKNLISNENRTSQLHLFCNSLTG